MTHSNIHHFHLYVATVLDTLYRHFPLECDLTLVEQLQASGYTGLIQIDEFQHIISDEQAKHQSRILDATIRWLENSGYITARNHRPLVVWEDACLTHRAIELLGATPPELSRHTPLGEMLGKAVQEGMTDTIRKGVTTLFNLATGQLN